MSNASSEEWTAALAAWDALDDFERQIALGYVASQAPQLLISAADGAKVTAAAAPVPARETGQANTAIAGLDGRQCRDVLSALAARMPSLILAEIAEVTGA
jgi:hypothetical protein